MTAAAARRHMTWEASLAGRKPSKTSEPFVVGIILRVVEVARPRPGMPSKVAPPFCRSAARPGRRALQLVHRVLGDVDEGVRRPSWRGGVVGSTMR